MVATTTANAQSRNTSLACKALAAPPPAPPGPPTPPELPQISLAGRDGPHPARNRARGGSTASNAANGRDRMQSVNLGELLDSKYFYICSYSCMLHFIYLVSRLKCVTLKLRLWVRFLRGETLNIFISSLW